MRLSGDYPELKYTVQFAESDASFAARLMERFGITSSWEHKSGNHILVLTDLAVNHPEIPAGSRPYYGVERLHLAEEEHFNSWKSGARMTTGAVRLTEYNFKTPFASQEVERASDAAYAHGQTESYDWPGDYLSQGEGNAVADRRLAAQEGQGLRITANGNISTLGAGGRVTLKGDAIPGATGRRFICLKAEHHLRAQVYGTSTLDEHERDYDSTYVMMPDTAPFRLQIRTQKPLIHDPQTAIVVGKGEIDCDEYGRVLVRFHWDLEGAHSMRCRVLQHSASGEYGGMIIPRIGMEAVVEFLEGDPDKPLVTGCVYNGSTDRPYQLPSHKTKHVMRADSHEGQGFNEISFEAQSGRENMAIHAQRDQTIRVLNDQSANISAKGLAQLGDIRCAEFDCLAGVEAGELRVDYAHPAASSRLNGLVGQRGPIFSPYLPLQSCTKGLSDFNAST
jgi:type VI secretion system secreted protein VgrG